MTQTLRIPLILAWLCLVVGCAGLRPSPPSGPWDLAALSQSPPVTWGARTGLVQEVYYEGEPLKGQPTRVFAYLGRPENIENKPSPAMLLVHGGGGKAFKEWAEHWAKRGYVALAMDLAGNGPAGRLPDGGPDQSDAVKFQEFGETTARDMWTYHAVSAVIRGHSLLRELPEVDAKRIGITGISWGGYLTCIVAGVDNRLKVAVPVYGCGFLGDNSYWKDRTIAAMSPDARNLWLELFDPGQYLGGVRCPILFLNGTTDFAYPLDSYQKSYSLVPDRLRYLSVVVSLPHGHIWTFKEVDAFVNAALKDEPRFPKLGDTRVEGNTVSARVVSPVPLKEGTLCYTGDAGPWHQRKWQTAPARIEGSVVTADLPSDAVRVAYLLVTDERGLRASSEHVEFPEAVEPTGEPSR